MNCRHSRHSRRAFSFTEILFAIMILGIGFIMVAAMFPVAIQQTQTSKAETIGAAMARSGVAVVQTMSSTNFLQVTGRVPPTPLCVLRPTVRFPGLNLFTDQDLYNAIQPGSPVNFTNALPAYPIAPNYPVPGTYVVNGDVWDFFPVAPTGYGAEPVAAVGSGGTLTPMNPPESLSALLVSMLSQNAVQTADPKYGWVAFYKRDLIDSVTIGAAGPVHNLSYAPSAQVIILATECKNSQQYQRAPGASSNSPPFLEVPSVSATAIPPPVNSPPPSLEASLSALQMPATILPPDSTHLDAGITFADPVQDDGKGGGRACEGAFVIIAFDAPGSIPLSNPLHGALNGRVYRLGAFNGDRWSFAPGYGPSTDLQNTPNRKFMVYVVGRGLNQDGDGNTPVYSGLAQDVAVYSTFISCPSN